MSKKSWIIIIAETLVFLFLLGSVIKCSNDRIDRLEHNIGAYKDQIEYVEMQNGELMAAKQSLILSEEELREELNISKRELKDLKKKLDDDIAYIAKLEGQVGLKDTVFMKGDTVFIEKGYTIKQFSWEDKWTSILASVKGSDIASSELFIESFNMNAPLEVGLTDDYRFWAKTPNPYIKFTDIQGAVIHGSEANKKEKRFHHGIYVGFGVHYGLFGKQWDFGPSGGYGFTYSF